MAGKTTSKVKVILAAFKMHPTHTLKVMASREWVESNCYWITIVCFTSPFWNLISIWSNKALQDISNVGTTEASTLVLSASYKVQTKP